MLCFKEKSKLLQPTATTTYACPPITSLRNSNSLTTTWQKTRQQQKEKQGCRLSRRPGQRLIFHFFLIFFSLWFRSDAQSVSPEPELPNSLCFPRLFVPLLKCTGFFPWKVRFFLRSEKTKKSLSFWSLCRRYTFTPIYLSIYLYPCACTSTAQYCDFHARQQQHVEWWIGYLFSAFPSATALQATPAAHSFWELHCASTDKSTPNPNEAYAFVACNNGGNDWFEIQIRRSNVKASKSHDILRSRRTQQRIITITFKIPQDWQHQSFTHLPHNYPKPSRPNKCNATGIESPNRWKTS